MHQPRSLVFARKSVGWPDGQSLAPSVGGHAENIFRTMFVTAVSETNLIVVLSYILLFSTMYNISQTCSKTIFVTNELVQPQNSLNFVYRNHVTDAFRTESGTKNLIISVFFCRIRRFGSSETSCWQ